MKLLSKLESGNLLSAGQVSEILGLHPDTVKRLARNGTLPALKFNSRLLRFRPSTVEAYINAADPSISRGGR